MLRFAPLSMIALLSTCGPPEPPFPVDYETQWREARPPCELSHDHELRWVRVFANELAFDPYTRHDRPYQPGAILLKAEYDDRACAEVVSYVVMERLPNGTTPPGEHDWTWRRFGPDRREIEDDPTIPFVCVDCHDWHCRELPYGWDYTCVPDGIEPPPR
jgi:hypothetical protein